MGNVLNRKGTVEGSCGYRAPGVSYLGENCFSRILGYTTKGSPMAKAPVRLSLKLQGPDRVGIVEGSCG